LASNRPATGQPAGLDRRPGAYPAPRGCGSPAGPPVHGSVARWPRPSPATPGRPSRCAPHHA